MVHVLAVRRVELHVIRLRFERRAGFNSLRFRFISATFRRCAENTFDPKEEGAFKPTIFPLGGLKAAAPCLLQRAETELLQQLQADETAIGKRIIPVPAQRLLNIVPDVSVAGTDAATC
jgi:hypothetical protein